MAHSPFFICILLISGLVQCFAAFSKHSHRHLQSNPRIRLNRLPSSPIKTFEPLGQHILYSSRDEEIADLEEKLRRLKGPTESEEVADETEITSAGKPETSEGEFVERRFKISDESTNMMVTGEELPRRSKVEPYEELLSEQWKTRETGNVDLKDLAVKIASVVAILAGIIAFSQVPIGQEGLDRYSTAKPSTAIDLGDMNPL